MHFRSAWLLTLAGLSSIVKAQSNSGSCPAIWNTISTYLTTQFLGSNGQCTDLARGAIRFAFHDAAEYSSKTASYAPASGGADGSLLLFPEEVGRAENAGLQSYYNFITSYYNSVKAQNISAADLVQFAGAHATVTCPGGPTVQAVVGRADATSAAPEGLLPAAFGPGSDQTTLVQLFQDKGFSSFDLTALVGAHTCSKAAAQEANGIPFDGPQDSTPGVWDIAYYGETYNAPNNVYRFDSDINLSDKSTSVGQQFASFVNNRGKWEAAFADAAHRLSILGIPEATASGFVDCTSALPRGNQQKRDIRARPINDRAR